jgi:hypothetical protein
LPPAPLRSAYGKLIGNFNPKLSYLLVHNSGAGQRRRRGRSTWSLRSLSITWPACRP